MACPPLPCLLSKFLPSPLSSPARYNRSLQASRSSHSPSLLLFTATRPLMTQAELAVIPSLFLISMDNSILIELTKRVSRGPISLFANLSPPHRPEHNVACWVPINCLATEESPGRNSGLVKFEGVPAEHRSELFSRYQPKVDLWEPPPATRCARPPWLVIRRLCTKWHGPDPPETSNSL